MASGVSQVSADSDLLPVLSLWPLAKVSAHTEAGCCPPLARRPLRFVQEILQ